MILKATKASSLVLSALSPDPRQAKVHSSYLRTVNILCDDMTWLSLHPRGVPLHAYYVGVGGKSDFSSQNQFLRAQVGESVSVSSAGIAIGGGRVTIDLATAASWQSGLELPSDLCAEDLARSYDALWELAGRMLTESSFLVAILERERIEVVSSHSIPSLMRIKTDQVITHMDGAWRSRSLKTTLDAMGDVIGLGTGLTPSGDDFLTGFLGASYFLSYDDAFRKKVFDGAAPLIHRTTLPSFFMLKGALAGHYPEPLSSLLRSLGEGENRELRRRFNHLTGIGATSGADMLAGVLFWIQISEVCGVSDEAHTC